MARKKGELTPWQLKVLETYGGGDYAHMTTIQEVYKAHNDTFLDGLGYFLVIELDPGEDCDSWAEASRRLETVFTDVEAARDAVDQAMPAEEAEDENGRDTRDYDDDGNLKSGD